MSEASVPDPNDLEFLEVERTVVNGIPVFFVPDDGPTRAGLVFRVGMADETIQGRGLSHLAEHLALSTLGNVRYEHNGEVDLTTTTFVARGTPAEIAGFLRNVCLAVSALPVARLRLEGRILRTEAASRTIGPHSNMAYLRYGYRGFGNGVSPEFFLNDPRPEPLLEWTAANFTAGNCACWIAGEMPKDLSLPLPAGARMALPRAEHIRNLRCPAHAPMGKDAVVMDYLSPRTVISTTLLRLLTKRMHEQVRQSKGLTYLVAANRESLSAELAENTVWMTCLPEQSARVKSELLSIVTDFSSSGPAQADLDEDLAMYVRHQGDTEARIQEVVYAALSELSGLAPSTQRELFEQRLAVDRASCIEEFTASVSTALLTAPAVSGPAPAGMTDYPMSCQPLVGRVLRPLDRKAGAETDILVVAAEGLSFVNPKGLASTVRWEDCVGVILAEGSQVHLLADDGFTIQFSTSEWENGGAAVQAIRDNVRPELFVSPMV